MAFIEVIDVYNKIIKYLNFDDFINQSLINKNCNIFITKSNKYAKYRNIFLHITKKICDLEKNKCSPRYYTMKIHKYGIALQFNSRKIINKFKLEFDNIPLEQKPVILNYAMKSNNAKIFSEISSQCRVTGHYRYSVYNPQFFYNNFYRYNLSNLVNYYNCDVNEPQKNYIRDDYLQYVYTNDIYKRCNVHELTKFFDRKFDNNEFIYLPNRTHYYDIVVRIIINLKIDYDILDKLYRELAEDMYAVGTRKHRKLVKYIKYYLPKQLKIKQNT